MNRAQEKARSPWFYGVLVLVIYFVLALIKKMQIFSSLGWHVGIIKIDDILFSLFLCWGFWLLPQVHPPVKDRYQRAMRGYGLVGAAVFLASNFAVGLFLNQMGQSPYDLSPMGILTNLFDLLPAIFACCFALAYGMNTLFHKTTFPLLYMTGIGLGLILLKINFIKIGHLSGIRGWFVFCAQDILPIIAETTLLLFLIYFGGALAGALYTGTIEVVLHIFPVLPSLPWIGGAALGVLIPTALLILLWEQFGKLSRRRKITRDKGAPGFAAFLLASIALIWFVVGVFPVYPSVVLTGSMEPLIDPGDIILVEKITQEAELYDLKTEDILVFQRGNIRISHRIMEILVDENQNISFRTKGDNNDSADVELVLPNDVRGKIIQVIPKIGMPVLILNSAEPIPEGVLEDADEEDPGEAAPKP